MDPWLDDGDVRLWHGDAIDCLRAMPAGSAQTCVTSPPFWGLRDYGTGTWAGGIADCDHKQRSARQDERSIRAIDAESGRRPNADGYASDDRGAIQFRDTCGKCGATRTDNQIGLEQTPDEWCARLVDVFREVRRVLRDDGSLWLEVGDSRKTYESDKVRGRLGGVSTMAPGLKTKDLVGAPWMLAFALRADGWYLRADCIWARPNPMPESVTDRPTKAHSYVFLLTKRARYFYDADAIREANSSPEQHEHNQRYAKEYAAHSERAADTGQPGNVNSVGIHSRPGPPGRNARSVWNIATEPTPFAHFATFPQALVERCILAGTSERGQCPTCGTPWARQVERGESDYARHGRSNGSDFDRADSQPGNKGQTRTASGTVPSLRPRAATMTGWAPTCTCPAAEPVPQIVLDPFMGSATTALVARRLGRHAIGCELNAAYLDIAAKRLQQLSLLGSVQDR